MNWIFQGNPDYFDIDGYLRDFSCRRCSDSNITILFPTPWPILADWN